MHFNFIPTFFIFFKRFSYLPPSISFKHAKSSDTLTLHYFFSLFIKKGRFLNFYKIFLSLLANLWTLLNAFRFGDLGLRNLQTIDIIYFNCYKRLRNFFNKFKFVFFFYFQKLNKLVYKHSNYKRPRYSFKLKYLPNFKRVKSVLKFMQKSLIYFPEKNFNERLSSLFFFLFLKKKNLYFYKFTLNLQCFILKKKKRLLLM